MDIPKHMHYYNEEGKYLDHGRYLDAEVGKHIHPFHLTNWLVISVSQEDHIIKVVVKEE